MKARRRIIAALALFLIRGAYACASIQATGATPSTATDLSIVRPTTAPASPTDTLSIVTWNLGYAGLGRNADFFADGGKAYLPPGRADTKANRDAIAAWLAASDADVILTQENASASVVNWWVDLKGAIASRLPDHTQAFYADFRTRWLPPPLRIRNGLATYSRLGVTDVQLWPLPNDGDPYDGALRRHYAAVAARIDGPGGGWTVINVHLAAFDEGAALRRRQISTLLQHAQAERALGRRVVIGGDWNLRLAQTDNPHTTEARYLFWVHDFPADLLPEGWTIAADSTVATVRTNERPYRPAENYTTVIDGFLLAPDVEVVRVAGTDLAFEHSDHQPVRVELRPR
ncbi:endonuclease/exonuclease/phosphatase family protein [Brevundimonas lutea]|uniref:endonuclease/exonuclease/phosphatase family protein n=1 Tax=Brevundimonas lutea TaxID=2293980 RepID=UPI000F034956|nr:endonuclease/exonuclease/phosphatase family protein [Brevundimonas lutea]